MYWEASKINLGMKNASIFPFKYEEPLVEQKKDDSDDKNFFVIGQFSGTLFCSGISLAGFLMLNELKDQTMKRCLATGLKTHHLFISQLMSLYSVFHQLHVCSALYVY